MRIGRINRYTSFGSEMSFTPKKGDQQSLVEIYVCSSSYPISLNCALQCSIYLFTLNWHPSTSTGDPHSCILWGVSRIWICAFQIIHHRWFFFMEVEENSSKPELSQTPELDADLPEKGLPRLVIEKLVLENFKSYAGVRVDCFHVLVIYRKLVLFIRTLRQL